MLGRYEITLCRLQDIAAKQATVMASQSNMKQPHLSGFHPRDVLNFERYKNSLATDFIPTVSKQVSNFGTIVVFKLFKM